MKAAILTKNKCISVKQIQEQKLGKDECKIKIEFCGICSSDINRSYGNGAYFYPLIMGHEVSGKIVEAGDYCKNKFKIGDRVSIFPLLPCFKCEGCLSKEYIGFPSDVNPFPFL